jgi:hypothetical protein
MWLIPFGLAKMRGIGGYNGWRWIFIIEGAATVVFAVFCYFVYHNTSSHGLSA